jgi:serine phosphatase RsbU (regulator of sigma subunit)
MEEAAKTLEHWLKDASLRAEGESATRIRELLEEKAVTQVVERMERIGELFLSGQVPAARHEANELAKVLELLARQLEVLHRSMVAPELTAMVELDRRVAELTAKLTTITTDAEIAEWRRLATDLVRDLEKAGLTNAATALVNAFEAGGWHWGVGNENFRVAPVGFTIALNSVSVALQARIQNLILKDMASARDEATPPQFKELVERYYEVISKEGGR